MLKYSYYSREDDDDIVSSGPGIEREVIYTAFRQFEKAVDQWFLPCADNLLTLAASCSMAAARYIAPAALSDLSVLAAVVALLLIHGITPGRLDPTVLQYFIYDHCNSPYISLRMASRSSPDHCSMDRHRAEWQC